MVTEYLDYLWELGELPVYIIGGVGVAWEPGSNGLAIACTWGSSKRTTLRRLKIPLQSIVARKVCTIA